MEEIRKLREKEFERAIAYITELIEVKGKIKELKKETEKNASEIKNLQEYHFALEILIKDHIDFVIKNHDFKLNKRNLKESLLKEYIYILSKKRDCYACDVKLYSLLENKADLAMLILETYGRKKEQLFNDIVNTDKQNSLPRCFEDYFPL